MENIRSIRSDKSLYFVLSDVIEGNIQTNRMITVIVFLYYEESLNYYLSYINKIPSFIDIYIVSSNENLYSKCLKFLRKKRNKVRFVNCQNRGRDISALLVACKDIALKYEYICYIHDKKRKNYIPEEDFNFWIENLWGNTLGSENYIINILNVLDENKEIGLLVPPEPIGMRLSSYYNNAWGDNYEITWKLADKLNLKCDIDYEKSPITLGTVFWAKSIALKKLFDKNWKYEDFDEEPLKDDGTISHAIERILGYVAQDAGYNTGTVMNTSYAGKLIGITQDYLSSSFHLMKKAYGVSQLGNFLKNKELIFDFCKRNIRLYLYGAGKVGKDCLHLLRAGGVEPNGFIVTRTKQENEIIEGLLVEELALIKDYTNMGIIITAGRKMADEIEQNLKSRNIKNYIRYLE